MKNNRLYIFLFALVMTFFATVSASAQVKVTASIDSLEMMIGEQTKIRVKVETPMLGKIEFPVFQDTIMKGVELLETLKPDTNLVNGNYEVSQSYLITAFDSALYLLPPMQVKVNGERFNTNALALKVNTFNLDSANVDEFFGPDSVHEVEYQWEDYAPALYAFLLALISAIVGGFLWRHYKKDKPVVRIVKVEKKASPHSVALAQIAQIKQQNLSQSADSKTYYTALTNIIRQYMEERFGFNAMEMTSSEIIDKLRSIDDASIVDLKELLQTADLVKFAKHNTQLNENDHNLVTAIAFIERTQQEELSANEPEVRKEIISDGLTQQQRLLLVIGFSLAFLLTIICLTWSVWKLIDLYI